jgi:hypothetical protein
MRPEFYQHPQTGRPEPSFTGLPWGHGFWNKLSQCFRRPSEPGSLWPALIGALVIAMVCMVVPAAAPDLGVDVSWGAVLDWAHARGAQFGKEIVFTYGPLGYLIAPYFLQAPQSSTILFSAALCFQIGLGLSLIAGRLGLLWRLALLSFFVLEAANADRKADLMLQVGLLCWGLLCITETGRRQHLCAASFILLSALAALMKVNYLFAGGFSACALTTYFVVRGERTMAWTLVPGFSGLVLLVWMVSGQHLSNFTGFIRGAYLLSREYDQAATLEGLPILRLGGILIGLIALITALLHTLTALDAATRRVWWQRTILSAWIAGQLLVVWKHSMVRMDRLHFFDLAVFGPVAGIALAALPGRSGLSRKIASYLSGACCLLSLVLAESAFLPTVASSCAQVITEASSHLEWLFRPDRCRVQFEPELEARREEAHLQVVTRIVGNGSVDVFGFHQAHALFNRLNYRPRPVFQSYLAYNRELSSLNEQFYLSVHAPEYVLFELAALEHRFGALGDALALSTLLANYKPVTNESGFLLLKRQFASEPRRILVEEGDCKMSSRLDVRRYSGTNLWIELEPRQNLWGNLQKLFYRPPALRLSVWDGTHGVKKAIARRQAAPSVLKSGFLCSPFFLETQQVMDFYEKRAVLRPGGFSIEPARGSEGQWRTAVHFRLYRME